MTRVNFLRNLCKETIEFSSLLVDILKNTGISSIKTLKGKLLKKDRKSSLAFSY